MKAQGLYDSSLQMFVEAPRPIDIRRLRFLRWLGEQGKLEHAIAGSPCGTCAEALPDGSDEDWPLAG